MNNIQETTEESKEIDFEETSMNLKNNAGVKNISNMQPIESI